MLRAPACQRSDSGERVGLLSPVECFSLQPPTCHSQADRGQPWPKLEAEGIPLKLPGTSEPLQSSLQRHKAPAVPLQSCRGCVGLHLLHVFSDLKPFPLFPVCCSLTNLFRQLLPPYPPHVHICPCCFSAHHPQTAHHVPASIPETPWNAQLQ